MGGTYGAYGREERCSQNCCGETLEKETTLNERCIEGRIILNWIFKK
jgi:hypothetical protein